MKHLVLSVVGPVFIALSCSIGAGAIASCASPTKNIKTALDITELACVLIEINTDPNGVAKACNIAEQYIPEVEKMLSAKKEAAKRLDTMGKASPSISASASASAPASKPSASASAKGK